jgi:pimeloyl-ACP methyl ester carboxylesterase
MPSIADLPQYRTYGLDQPVYYTSQGSGTPLLLIHGSLCDYRYWRWQVPALAAQHQVVAPSLRGCWPAALQEPDAGYSVGQHARDLAGLIREVLEDRPAHVLGHSRGAQVAVELAKVAPHLVNSLTLADPGFKLKGEAATASVHGQAVELLRDGATEAALSLFVDTVNGPGTWAKMVGWFKAMVRDNAYTLLSQIREIDLAVDPGDIRNIGQPVLLMGGAQSPARYGSRLDMLQEFWPDARRVTIPLASHGMNLANPKAFNAAVMQFLAALPER